MNRLPREPLDAEERALAARLPRLHGRDEPDAALDARILAAAHAALAPAPIAKRRRGWIVPLEFTVTSIRTSPSSGSSCSERPPCSSSARASRAAASS